MTHYIITFATLASICFSQFHGVSNAVDVKYPGTFEKHLKTRNILEKELMELRSPTTQVPQKTGKAAADICPVDSDIYPCICLPSVDGSYADIDCSAAIAEDQLEIVFQANFPVHSLRGFKITNNYNIYQLTKNFFGVVTFKIFLIDVCILNSIASSVFDNFDYSLEQIQISYTKVTETSFPFNKLPELTQLKSLYLLTDVLDKFPSSFSSSSLETVNFSGNEIPELPQDAFNDTRFLTNVYMSSNKLVSFFSNTFSYLKFLETIDMSSNEVRAIPSNSFRVDTVEPLTINLASNIIDYIGNNAFEGVIQGTIDLSSNQLTDFDESAFGGVLFDETIIYINDNPLTCGCDMAWVVQDGYLAQISGNSARCSNGKLVGSLQNSDFSSCS